MPVFDMVEQIKTRLHDESFLVKRTIFPVTLASALQDQNGLQLEKKPLLFGHQYVYALYLCILKVLGKEKDDAKKETEVLRLLQCALTPTVQIKTHLSAAQKSKWSIDRSNMTISQKLTADNFITTAFKAFIAIGLGPGSVLQMSQAQKVKAMADQELWFGSLKVNKAMVNAMEKINDGTRVNAKSLDLLRLIESHFGRAVITEGYTKLKKTIDICEKEISATRGNVADAVQRVLEYLFCAMSTKLLTPSK